jgi:molybdopterin converting factor subunit 1
VSGDDAHPGKGQAVAVTPEGESKAEEQAGDDDGQLVAVLFFASAREAAGTNRTRARADGRTVAELLDELVCTYGQELKAVLATCAIWVNGSPASGTTVLAHGDEVAVLPPVSGGAVASLDAP